MEDILNALQPHLLEILATILTAIGAWVAAQLKKRLHVDIEAKNRDALWEALTNAADLFTDTHMTQEQKVKAVTDYASEYAKDAIKKFALSKFQLEEKALIAITRAARKLINR